MKVYEALANAFMAEGTSAVFGLIGDANSDWAKTLTEHNVDVYTVRHESNALAMADGWSFMRDGAVGVCTTTCGPGTTQLATSMVVSNRNRTPIVAFCGGAPTSQSDINPSYSQEFDHKRFAEGIECHFVGLKAPEFAYEAVREAFYLARRDSRPVMFTAPLDMQMAEFDDTEEYVPSTTLLNSERLAPNPQSIAEAADIIVGSRRPVILLGNGAKRAGVGDEVLALADRIGAVLATTMVAKNYLSEDEFNVRISGLYSTKVGMEIIEESDCVLAIGASMNFYTMVGGYLYQDARIIQIDARPQSLLGNGRTADCYIQADAALGVEKLNEEIVSRRFAQVGRRTPETKARLKDAFIDSVHFDIDEGELDPREVCAAIDEQLPPEIGLVTGLGHSSSFAISLFTRERPFVIARKGFGCIGQALPNAMGGIVASNMRPALVVDGDVGSMVSLIEIETAVRYRIPLLMCILNDEGNTSERRTFEAKGEHLDLAEVSTPDLGAVAVAFGGRGRLVRTIPDLKEAIQEFVESPGPMVIDVRISPNVMNVQVRRTLFGQDET